MPSSTFSRHSRPPSPPSATDTYLSITPARSAHSRRTSTSYTPTITSGGQQAQKVNITRLAIEGRARQNADGASVKVYLKISFPIDSVTPGATIPLFQEENVKILESQVHPLDNNSIPYNFSSNLAPLLHNAARALNLPPRSSETFYSAFTIPAGSSSIPSSSSRIHLSETDSESTSPVDPYYTGQVLVSNYAISYILPKVFLTRSKAVQDQENTPQSSYRNRRASVSGRDTAQFMAAIDMWVPYVSKPPRSPYLLSIPIPRCLHNHIKLRIFPPISTSSSVASLASIEDDPSAWDLASDPHVTRVISNRLARTNSYSHFADDESSDSSSPTISDGCSIQGTFPSAERIRIRWARPMKVIDVPDGGDGRRRVGVREVKGDMTCSIQGKYKDPEKKVDGIIMHVAYKGTCKGIWFPGVATLLGMDVGLEAKNSDVSWVPGFTNTWEVAGGVGYTGFDVGLGLSSPSSRTSSLDSSLSGLAPPPDQPRSDGQVYTQPNESTPSLLRVPLPAQNVGEYSFDGSINETASLDGTSSVPSSMQVSTTSNAPRPPGTQITLHLNMNELLPPVQNVFTFTLSGTILLTPRMTIARVNRQGFGMNAHSEPDEGAESEPMVLPRFTILAADAEVTSTSVRSDVESSAFVLEVYNATGDLNDAQIRKTVLQKGGSTKCGDDGGRIVLKSIRQLGVRSLDTSPRPLTPNGHIPSHALSNSPLLRPAPWRPKRDGALIIPAVDYKVTLFMKSTTLCYAVHAVLTVPSETNSDWLEFGLALPRTRKRKGKPPRVSIVNASIEGVPVRTEMISANASDKTVATGVIGSPDKAGGADWIAWIKLHAGTSGGTVAVVDYLVKCELELEAREPKQNSNVEHLLLPTFSLPIGRLDGRISVSSDLLISKLNTNLAVQRIDEDKCKFSHFSTAEFFIPQASFTVEKKRKPAATTFTPKTALQLLPWLALFITLLLLQRVTLPMKELTHLAAHLPERVNQTILTLTSTATESITVTTTVYSTITVTSTAEHVSRRTDTSSPLTVTQSTSDSITTNDQSASIITTQSPRPVETAALSSPSPPLWPIPWSVENMRTDVVVDKMRDVAEVVWQWLRRAYHYPLNPP
ncbi:hypothetical protein M378DRAFT_69096 [Amanita muscaria Koide BX008]|uniref:Uncharacterized protein n=1 Tax=Amanita muscaria (strain Koide BX008) TaxID=946122 RepID=A0A0C2XK10_AMAMK|nr:hypothetical protein M378DRAFT_69096 [Amanita muscaria Koide BX008]